MISAQKPWVVPTWYSRSSTAQLGQDGTGASIGTAVTAA